MLDAFHWKISVAQPCYETEENTKGETFILIKLVFYSCKTG